MAPCYLAGHNANVCIMLRVSSDEEPFSREEHARWPKFPAPYAPPGQPTEPLFAGLCAVSKGSVSPCRAPAARGKTGKRSSRQVVTNPPSQPFHWLIAT
jgi:hypothetical protein